MGYDGQGKGVWPECELRVFYRLSLLNFVLAGGGSLVMYLCSLNGILNPDPVFDVWLVVFALPVYAALHFNWPTLALLLMCLVNPFAYGAMWWSVWRMVRLMRPKPAEDDSPPLHNE